VAGSRAQSKHMEPAFCLRTALILDPIDFLRLPKCFVGLRKASHRPNSSHKLRRILRTPPRPTSRTSGPMVPTPPPHTSPAMNFLRSTSRLTKTVPMLRPSQSADGDDDSDSQGRSPVELYPAKMIRKENFFKTILNNPEDAVPSLSSGGFRASSRTPPSSSPYHKHAQSQSSSKSFPAPFGPDPITTGIMDENQATVLFDLVFLRLNPFINLFDPALHSVHYVRSRCPLLFTTLSWPAPSSSSPRFTDPAKSLPMTSPSVPLPKVGSRLRLSRPSLASFTGGSPMTLGHGHTSAT
jgi:hypothetical protein